MATQIKIRRDSYANWFNVNPTLGIGEPGYDTTNRKLKIGDGTTLWRALSYFDDQVTDLSAYAGDIVPSVDVSQSIGSPAKRWQKGFFSGNAVYLGDIKLSNNNGTLVVQRVTNAGLSNEAAVPSTPGSVTTDRLVNGASVVSLLANGSIVTPAFTIPSTPGTSGQVLKWPGIGTTLVWGPDNNSGTGGSGGASVTTDATPPVAPSLGDLWYDTDSGRIYIYFDSSWVDANPALGSSVDSITAGVGLSGGTITSSGTIAIANTTVTAGSYSLANITVNAQGQITSASNGTFPTFADVAISGSYSDLTNKPTIPAAQIQSDWTQASNVALDFIKNKPTLFSGSYADLTNKPTIPSLTGYATETYVTTRGYLTSVGTISYTDLTNKPTIPAAQVQSDWNAISGLGVVLNKPALFDGAYSSLSGKPTLFSGSYTDLTDKPAIPAAYSATSINALSDVDTATNVPTAGQPLVWNAVSSSWVPGSIVAASLTTLSDVTITSPAPGQVLKYNGSSWINDVDAVSGGAGVGSVTNVSVASANGFAGSVATSSSTPDITISTSITGILRGTGIAITAATSGTDFAPGTSALTTGIVKSTTTTGALSIAVAGTDYQAPIGTITGLVKGNGANALTAAVTGTDYQAPIGTISGIVKGNGANALTAAINGTDYAPGTSTLTTGIVKSTTTTGALSIAVADTDYQTPVSATGILKSSGVSGNVTAATAGTDYQSPVSATGILKSSGVSGNVSAAVAGTDYQSPVSATGILKSSGVSGNVTAAVAGTDYQSPIILTTTGSSGAATFISNTLNIPQYTVTATTVGLGNVTNESKATMFTSPTFTGTVTLGDVGSVSITGGTNGYVLSTNGSGVLSWVAQSGGSSSNTFTTIAVAGQTSVEADSTTDTLTLVAGTNVTITTDATTDTITINATGSGTGATSLDGLSDVAITSAASGQVLVYTGSNFVNYSSRLFHQFAYPAITALDVTTNGLNTAYLFNNQYSGDDPTITASSGTTIAFNLNVTGHPFLIQTGGGVNYDTGLIHVAVDGTVSAGTNAQGKVSGTLYWQIPATISGGYKYRCSIHSLMTGTITIQSPTSPTFTAGTINSMSIGATTRSTGAFTTLAANSTATFTGAITANTVANNQSYTTTGAGTITISSGTAGTINNMSIGATTRSTGAFTTLAANSAATFTSSVTVQQLTEVLNTKTAATGTVTHDLSTGAVFYHSSISANFTANFTNVPTTNNRTLSVVLILSQGATAYLPTAVQIDGVGQNILWQGAAYPAGTANKVDIISYTLINAGSWVILGSQTIYGSAIL